MIGDLVGQSFEMRYRDFGRYEDVVGEGMRERPVPRTRGSYIVFCDEIAQSGVFQHVDTCGIGPKIEITGHNQGEMYCM